MSQLRPLGTATDVYIHGQNISALTQGTVLHEALHNLTGLRDDDLKRLLDLAPGDSDTSNINDVLVQHGCAGND